MLNKFLQLCKTAKAGVTYDSSNFCDGAGLLASQWRQSQIHLLETEVLFHRHVKYSIKKTRRLKRIVILMTQIDPYRREDLWVFQDVRLSGKIQEMAAIGSTMQALSTIVFDINVYQFSMNHHLHFRCQCLYSSRGYKYTQFIWLFRRKL